MTNIVVFIRRGENLFYCFGDKEYWIMEWWGGYVDSNKGEIEELYFIFLQQFIVDVADLKVAYLELLSTNDTMEIDGNLPMVYIDFDSKLFLSNYYDQALENRLLPGWGGRFEIFYQLIPKKYRYWEKESN